MDRSLQVPSFIVSSFGMSSQATKVFYLEAVEGAVDSVRALFRLRELGEAFTSASSLHQAGIISSDFIGSVCS